MRNFFTADLHLFHNNIIKYCNRPFKSVTEMNETIICHWNEVVNDEDHVWILGDLSYKINNISLIKQTIALLKGKKHLIVGNHDQIIVNNLSKFKNLFVQIYYNNYGSSIIERKFYNKYIIMCHYPMKSWNHSYNGSWHLYGHCHGVIPEDNSFSFDVGIDCWNFYPVSFEQIKEKMKTKTQNLA